MITASVIQESVILRNTKPVLVSVASIDRSGTTLFWWQRWDLLRSKGSSDTSQASGEIEELRRVKEKREDKGKGLDLED